MIEIDVFTTRTQSTEALKHIFSGISQYAYVIIAYVK